MTKKTPHGAAGHQGPWKGRAGMWYERKRMRMEGLLLLAARLSAHAVSLVLAVGCGGGGGGWVWASWASGEGCAVVAAVGVMDSD